jgi:hypothetical protein
MTENTSEAKRRLRSALCQNPVPTESVDFSVFSGQASES